MNQGKSKQETAECSHQIEPNAEKPVKRLLRSRNQRVIAGVCGGLGQYFNTDPVWFRLLFIILLFCVGFTFVVYLLMWLIMPLGSLEV